MTIRGKEAICLSPIKKANLPSRNKKVKWQQKDALITQPLKTDLGQSD